MRSFIKSHRKADFQDAANNHFENANVKLNKSISSSADSLLNTSWFESPHSQRRNSENSISFNQPTTPPRLTNSSSTKSSPIHESPLHRLANKANFASKLFKKTSNSNLNSVFAADNILMNSRVVYEPDISPIKKKASKNLLNDEKFLPIKGTITHSWGTTPSSTLGPQLIKLNASNYERVSSSELDPIAKTAVVETNSNVSTDDSEIMKKMKNRNFRIHSQDDIVSLSQNHLSLESLPEITILEASPQKSEVASFSKGEAENFLSSILDVRSHKDSGSDSDSDTSRFSFEYTGLNGRTSSVKYYSKPDELQVEKNEKVYIDDLYEDENFDEDMNFYQDHSFEEEYSTHPITQTKALSNEKVEKYNDIFSISDDEDDREMFYGAPEKEIGHPNYKVHTDFKQSETEDSKSSQLSDKIHDKGSPNDTSANMPREIQPVSSRNGAVSNVTDHQLAINGDKQNGIVKQEQDKLSNSVQKKYNAFPYEHTMSYSSNESDLRSKHFPVLPSLSTSKKFTQQEALHGGQIRLREDSQKSYLTKKERNIKSYKDLLDLSDEEEEEKEEEEIVFSNLEHFTDDAENYGLLYQSNVTNPLIESLYGHSPLISNLKPTTPTESKPSTGTLESPFNPTSARSCELSESTFKRTNNAGTSVSSMYLFGQNSLCHSYISHLPPPAKSQTLKYHDLNSSLDAEVPDLMSNLYFIDEAEEDEYYNSRNIPNGKTMEQHDKNASSKVMVDKDDDYYLDEINTIPEDYDYDSESYRNDSQIKRGRLKLNFRAAKSASSDERFPSSSLAAFKETHSFNSKPNGASKGDTSLKNKLKINNRTVTFFNHAPGQPKLFSDKHNLSDQSRPSHPAFDTELEPSLNFFTTSPGYTQESSYSLSPILETVGSTTSSPKR
ncbi:hypothetical protein KAFR_0I02430 [Kazachstania africana CBS 2517]|uniref:Zinc-regulated protein 8 n=1 Tax=Kazachstania africana (strain ATCC 22294 / BCRC 22015 / CBS 2517 / CECT 1963 / NBRC 1671 / NRRL Y-8276) TaxID=1071382 RepID=H2B072_KAZAF|nr:hypothetical protein KAFR_0I02430 [Kazachstania africana CBS 2517]CCF60022.1 hypothetical protein KAFR_0I02430 [Kazachstania africana CBS 2517]